MDSLLSGLPGQSDDLCPRLPQVRAGHHLRQHLCNLLKSTLGGEGGGERGVRLKEGEGKGQIWGYTCTCKFSKYLLGVLPFT